MRRPRAVSNAFARRYRAEVGYIPAYIAAEWYDIVKIFAHAIEHGGYDGPSMRDAIANLKGLPSVLGGTITMGPNHYSEFAAAGLWQVKAGKLIRLA
jgi:ABC-type branched-subunit amino acid transport system substrate-binding protein